MGVSACVLYERLLNVHVRFVPNKIGYLGNHIMLVNASMVAG
jgi:hypothetical protein